MHLAAGWCRYHSDSPLARHESPVTTHGQVKANLRRRQQALNLLSAPGVHSARFQAKDKLLRFQENL